MTRSRAYPLAASALALIAPVGLVIARALAAGRLPTVGWAIADVATEAATYAYVAASTMAVFAVAGLRIGRWVDQASLESSTDPLTGLFNRRHFGLRLAEEIARSNRHGGALCVLCLDLDARRAGDLVLDGLSRSLLESVRGIDVVARIGGNAFAVVLPETTATQAAALAARILRRTRTPAVSIGIAELDSATEVTPDDMLAAADAALFRAKASGGGRAAVARPEAVAAHSRHFTLMEAAILLDDDKHPAANDGGESLRHESSAECPACRRMVSEICGDSLLQQTWFRFAGHPGKCATHRPHGRGES